MTTEERRALLLSRSTHAKQNERGWRDQLRGENLVWNILRAGVLALVLIVVAGVWTVSSAHLGEQFLASPQKTAGLINPNANQFSLSPDSIEQQVLALNLKLQEPELYVPAGTDPRQRPFRIEPGEPARFIAARLAEEGFITDPDLFNLYLRVTGLERNIEAGNFMLAQNMTMPQVAESLQNALFEEAVVTIPEGMRSEEIAERLSAANVIEEDVFLAAVRNPQSLSLFDDFDFLQSIPPNGSLEGFLFPDTYRFPVLAATPEQVLRPFLANFEDRVGNKGLVGGSSGLSGRDLVSLAGIVEREAVQSDERPLIASVYLNRLNNKCPEVGGNYLQADPTVQYARGTVGNWWWKPQSIQEYAAVQSPFNTYLYPGLPPAPISNPGLSAIDATRNPAQTGYCFFVATGEDGRHIFAQTYGEQQQNLQIYGYNP
ncbi:MAG: endolytic transglycosylase MltG [Anaerolineales bacterium]|nr:endolytic transglycosylase MltG [Anaerolineales bacterium]